MNTKENTARTFSYCWSVWRVCSGVFFIHLDDIESSDSRFVIA